MDFQEISAGREGEGRGGGRRRRFLCGLVIGRVRMRATGAALLGAGAEGFVDDGLDRAGTAAALGAAAEASVDLLGIARQVRSCTHGIPDIVVAQDVAGTDDHGNENNPRDATSSIWKSAERCKRKSRIFKQFQTDAGQILE